LIITIDTNVLVYVQDSRDPIKNAIASEIFLTVSALDDTRIALQVLGELYSVLTRKLKQDASTAKQAVEAVATVFEPFGYRTSDVFAALNLADAGVLSYWDGLLVSAADQAGCNILISEDMQNGFSYGSLEIISPFIQGKINSRLAEIFEMAK